MANISEANNLKTKLYINQMKYLYHFHWVGSLRKIVAKFAQT